MSNNYEYGPHYYDPDNMVYRIPSQNSVFSLVPIKEAFDIDHLFSTKNMLILIIVFIIYILLGKPFSGIGTNLEANLIANAIENMI
jgi:hypothetical protein